VSFEEFERAMRELYKNTEFIREDNFLSTIRDVYEALPLPKRGTARSAGYDIHTPAPFELAPNCSIKIPTGIRVLMEDDWCFVCAPRSGQGVKYRLQLANTLGVVDADYSNADNEGHIWLTICNDTYESRIFFAETFDRIAQGIFLPYGITVDDDADGKRTGGFGSTDVKNK